MSQLYREVTPLSQDECFTVFSRIKSAFDFPLHCHDEFELNYIAGAKGAKRIVGYHMSEIEDAELVLVGGGLPHAWFTHHCASKSIHEITLQFHSNLFDDKFLSRNQMAGIRNLLKSAVQGVAFPPETIAAVGKRLTSLTTQKGFNSLLELMTILNELSLSPGIQVLSTASPTVSRPDLKSRRLEKVFDYIRSNYERDITLSEISAMVNMPQSSFSRFIKKRTGRTFVESLNDIRLGHAMRMLITTTQTVAEISYKCGFNNLSYFNRLFRRKNGCTPIEFRENYADSKVFI